MRVCRLTQEEVRRSFDYDPTTGILSWRERDDVGKSWNVRFAGKPAGAKTKDGYLRVKLNGVRLLVHQMIWLFVFGYVPDEIDHQNQRKSDNRLSNIREVSRLENARNHTMQANNTSGHTGVYWDKGRGLWRAFVCVGKRQKHLGHFVDFNEAIAARLAANDNLNFHVNHGRRKAS
ncbi:HNH endonuclease [Agrobacterium tumefaciens]|uniref:HNH endonuclease n=1 Tax=Agrobacterium tumefaciens complex TaxID=1183400 RepID=UPI0015746234|nr:HNH endonuclease [Agrobacterium tumefaciens]NTA16041.1 HNH endonuclease [Agrobacterium tumefaciens]WCK69613.1 HNH endonuclease [Agrobacterium tumefaciens]